MDTLTIIFVGAVVLLVAFLIGRQFTGRKTQTPLLPPGAAPAAKRVPKAQARQVAPPKATATVRTKPAPVQNAVELEEAEIARLRLKLINCFGGNRATMERSISFEWGKSPHLSEKDLLKKMLYDFERKR